MNKRRRRIARGRRRERARREYREACRKGFYSVIAERSLSTSFHDLLFPGGELYPSERGIGKT